jgi:hypothetical protein
MQAATSTVTCHLISIFIFTGDPSSVKVWVVFAFVVWAIKKKRRKMSRRDGCQLNSEADAEGSAIEALELLLDEVSDLSLPPGSETERLLGQPVIALLDDVLLAHLCHRRETKEEGDGEKKRDRGECARQAAALSGEGTFLAISRKSDEERTFFLKNGISSARTADRA